MTGNLSLSTNTNLYLDGGTNDSYFTHNGTYDNIRIYVDDTAVVEWNPTYSYHYKDIVLPYKLRIDGSSGGDTYIAGSGNTINMVAGGVTTTITAAAVSSVDFIASSDIRLKNVTGSITNALATVNKLNAIRYTWKDKEDGKEHIGFSAQEVLELVPEAVYGSEETEYGISYGKLVPVLVEAIKELTAEVEALKKKVGG
jgi:hypothetical protein